ncbi:MAG: AMP-dependent synthetase, partial [Aeromicrobium sp.]|nr:AMP-dependent synthetase [Aeromicrobium sp.]
MLPVDPDLEATYRARGWWDGSTLPTLLASAYTDHGRSRLRIHSTERPFTGTLSDVLATGQSLAGGLRDRGIGPGDVVAFQLPNWAESLACFVGVTLSGAVLLPIAPYYRSKEIAFILERSAARVFIVPEQFN